MDNPKHTRVTARYSEENSPEAPRAAVQQAQVVLVGP
jgi:hypothetical protein